MDRLRLESLWRDAGLDAALLPEEPTAERALKQAVREAQVGRWDRLIRLGLDSEAKIVFAETISSDVSSDDIVQVVFAGFRTLRTTHTADDVRRAIVKALDKWAAVTLRDGGGIYWVPAVYAADLRRLQVPSVFNRNPGHREVIEASPFWRGVAGMRDVRVSIAISAREVESGRARCWAPDRSPFLPALSTRCRTVG